MTNDHIRYLTVLYYKTFQERITVLRQERKIGKEVNGFEKNYKTYNVLKRKVCQNEKKIYCSNSTCINNN